jgi:hypothetical protein
MAAESRRRERHDGERHATRERTKSESRVADDATRSHREVAAVVRDADRFAINVPVVGRIRIPRPDQLAFYGTLGALVVVELVDWPVALAIGAAHALFSDPPQRQTSSEDDD